MLYNNFVLITFIQYVCIYMYSRPGLFFGKIVIWDSQSKWYNVLDNLRSSFASCGAGLEPDAWRSERMVHFLPPWNSLIICWDFRVKHNVQMALFGL